MSSALPLLIAAILTTAPSPSPSPADLLLQVPAGAEGALTSGRTVEGTLTRDGLSSDGRPQDCWVLGIEPGDDVIVTAASPDFHPRLAILPEPVCTGRQPIYRNDGADRTAPNARVAFNADRNAYAVLIAGAASGDLGRYRLTFTGEIAGGVPGRTDTISEPERLVRRLYADDGLLDFNEPAVIDRVFAPAVGDALKALNEETEGLGLGFDFLVDGQDSDITDPVIRMDILMDRSALVEARFSNMGEPIHMVFHLRETPNGWRVEDIESLTPDMRQNWVMSRLLGLDLGFAAARQE